jgi:hypothetical protein
MAEEEELVEVDDAPVPDGKTARVKKAYGRVPAIGKIDHPEREKFMAAGQALVAKRQAERAKALKLRQARPDLIFYVECQRSDCLGPGIWIYGDPQNPLGPSDWESAYHPRGAYWPPTELPYCQCCEANFGRRFALKMFFTSEGILPNQVKTGIIANQNYIRELTRAEYDALLSGSAEKNQE